LQRKNVKLDYVLRELQKQTGYNILFDQRIIPASARVNLNYKDAQLNKVLNEVLAPFGIKYKQTGKTIVLNNEATTKPLPIHQQDRIRGKVQDTNGTPISGVTIRVNDSMNEGALTGQNGDFSILAGSKDRLTFSYIGKESVTITVGDRKELLIVLRDQ